ncbi:2OG-Fe(II) oxygenase [Synechococcus sp. 1G10]|uniref:2OG-Fe(II) oxygenase n=1 Tax=Synechococcus sp. 1G10 TaxID=2025605 RepID=UPI000B983C16|nr:2OG-Fe(II) oxygenase [Synechococcus sp. 1G10]
MRLIATYRNPGYDALAEAALGFYARREDLRRPGVAFGNDSAQPAKVSTDISLVAIDRSDPEAHGLAELILRGVSAGLDRYLKERPLLLEVCPERSLFVNPIFNLQRYAPGEGFRSWHCDWTTSEEATEPIRRVLAWILYLNTLPDGGTEFHWQDHHEEAERGKLLIFPASPSHTHRGRVSQEHTKTIATGWINAGTLEAYIARLAAP